MDVRALILVGGSRAEGEEVLGGIPIGLLDVLGKPVLQRVLDRLEKFGISGAGIVTEVPPSKVPLTSGSVWPGMRWAEGEGANFWRAAENSFNDLAQAGAELVLVIRLGAYTEIDYEELVQFHLDAGCRVTRVSDFRGIPLDTFAISASRRNDAAYLFRHELREMRVPCDDYQFAGYVNRLEHARNLRTLALDGFAGIASIPPCGTQIKPGIWVGEHARVHKRARLLAPCFVGANTKIRASAVLTRGSVVEHHTVVDCGTVVENSSILPMTVVGAGLDVTHSVVGFRHIWHLRRDAEVEISDEQLIGALRSAPIRMLDSAAQFAMTLPRSMARLLLNKKPSRTPELSDSVCRPAAALKKAQPEDALETTDFLPVRRYGNE